MNKETRIFILGFVWIIIGGLVVSERIFWIIEGVWSNNWYEYVFMCCGIITTLNGLNLVRSVTKWRED